MKNFFFHFKSSWKSQINPIYFTCHSLDKQLHYMTDFIIRSWNEFYWQLIFFPLRLIFSFTIQNDSLAHKVEICFEIWLWSALCTSSKRFEVWKSRTGLFCSRKCFAKEWTEKNVYETIAKLFLFRQIIFEEFLRVKTCPWIDFKVSFCFLSSGKYNCRFIPHKREWARELLVKISISHNKK